MPDFLYKLRRKLNHMKRRNASPSYISLNNNRGLSTRRFNPVPLIIIVIFILCITGFLMWALGVFDEKPTEPVIVYSPTPVPATASPSATPKQQVTPTNTPIPTDENIITATVIADSLHVRSAANTDADILGRLYKGDRVEIIEAGDWCVILYNDDFGYVVKEFVQFDPEFITTPTPTPEPTPSPTPTPTPVPTPTPTPTPERMVLQHWEHTDGELNIQIDKIKEAKTVYYVAEVKCPATQFMTALASDTAEVGAKERPSVLAKSAEAVLAINGDYCGYRDTGVIIRNGQLLRNEPVEEMATLYENGNLEMYHSDETDGEDMMKDKAWQSWSFGPVLVKAGKAYDNFQKKSALWKLNPRTGIGMVAPGHYILVVVDGRTDDSEGMTLDTFAALFERLGCQTAYNLDGGATSIMIFNGEIINNPSGTYERQTSDIIYFK